MGLALQWVSAGPPAADSGVEAVPPDTVADTRGRWGRGWQRQEGQHSGMTEVGRDKSGVPWEHRQGRRSSRIRPGSQEAAECHPEEKAPGRQQGDKQSSL